MWRRHHGFTETSKQTFQISGFYNISDPSSVMTPKTDIKELHCRNTSCLWAPCSHLFSAYTSINMLTWTKKILCILNHRQRRRSKWEMVRVGKVSPEKTPRFGDLVLSGQSWNIHTVCIFWGRHGIRHLPHLPSKLSGGLHKTLVSPNLPDTLNKGAFPPIFPITNELIMPTLLIRVKFLFALKYSADQL